MWFRRRLYIRSFRGTRSQLSFCGSFYEICGENLSRFGFSTQAYCADRIDGGILCASPTNLVFAFQMNCPIFLPDPTAQTPVRGANSWNNWVQVTMYSMKGETWRICLWMNMWRMFNVTCSSKWAWFFGCDELLFYEPTHNVFRTCAKALCNSKSHRFASSNTFMAFLPF